MISGLNVKELGAMEAYALVCPHKGEQYMLQQLTAEVRRLTAENIQLRQEQTIERLRLWVERDELRRALKQQIDDDNALVQKLRQENQAAEQKIARLQTIIDRMEVQL